MKIRAVGVALMHGDGRTDLHDKWAYIFIRNCTCVKNAKVEGVFFFLQRRLSIT